MWTYNQTTNSDELYHYGVLGMKLGRRRYQNPDGSLTSKGQKKVSKKYKKLSSKAIRDLSKKANSIQINAYNKAVDHMNNKNYKKSQALVKKYNMTKWNDLAKDNDAVMKKVR